VELGLINSTIHKVDERTSVYDLELLSLMYRRVLERLVDAEVWRTEQLMHQMEKEQNNNISNHHHHQQQQQPTYYDHVDIDALP
jgi:hypothetical protein